MSPKQFDWYHCYYVMISKEELSVDLIIHAIEFDLNLDFSDIICYLYN